MITLRSIILAFLSVLLLALTLLVPVTARAQDEAIDDACANSSSSPICRDLQRGDDPVTGDDGLFVSVFNVLSIIAGIIAVIIIVIGGIQMMTADGDPQKFTSARNLFIYAMVGIFIVFFAQAIVRLIVLSLID